MTQVCQKKIFGLRQINSKSQPVPSVRRNRSMNPVLADGFFQEAEAEAGEQFHGSSAS